MYQRLAVLILGVQVDVGTSSPTVTITAPTLIPSSGGSSTIATVGIVITAIVIVLIIVIFQRDSRCNNFISSSPTSCVSRILLKLLWSSYRTHKSRRRLSTCPEKLYLVRRSHAIEALGRAKGAKGWWMREWTILWRGFLILQVVIVGSSQKLLR